MQWDNAQDLFDALSAPFPIEEVSWRVGPTNERYRKEGEPLKGRGLCYIDARAVMDRLDSVCGPENWQDTYTPGVAKSIVCNIGVRIGDDWVWKADGAGETDMEAEKGALSDAFKRAAVRWGIGRYLYEIKSPLLPLNERKAFGEPQLETLNKIYEEHARKVRPVIGVHAYRQAYKLLISSIHTITPEEAAHYGSINSRVIADLPTAMRDHVMATLQEKIGAAA